MLYAGDARWWRAYGAEVERACLSECWTCSERMETVNYVEGVDEPGLSIKPGRIHLGGNSGYQAINLAYMFGAARIIMLGYDMQRTGGRTHHHGDHDGGLPNLGHLPDWVERMVQLGIDLRERGVEVINATRETAIKCFERQPIEDALRLGKPPIYVQGMQGLGDNIYQRAVVRELTRDYSVSLETPWPQLYADLPIRCVRPQTRLRTQAKNIAGWDAWAQPPRGVAPARLSYAGSEGTMLECLCRAAGIQAERLTFDLPPLEVRKRKPYAVIRPATMRVEWPADSRNPRPEYLALAAEKLRRHYHIVSVADLERGAERAVGPLPYADETYHAGELGIEELLALVAGAAAVVGGVGWLVPAAVALRVPMLLLYGGWGQANGPARIFDRRMNTELIHQAIPSRFCLCVDRDHACDKRIDDFDAQLERWIVGLGKGRSPAVAARGRRRVLPGQRAAV